jgi:hypothetical protein
MLQVPVEEGAVDLHERILGRHVHRQGHEQALQARVDDESTGGGIHARDVLRVMNHLGRELRAIEPVSPAEVLANVRDGHRGVVSVQLGHVEVVNKVNELVVSGGPVVDASFLLQLGLQDLLERDDIGEVVEVDVQAHVPLWQRCELTLHQLGLASTGGANEHDGRT